ncbi:MAG: carbohydrate kinase family protein [Oscillospiraceae bacterium]|nr:carbohydrate kinase family protein [Oscillospiraceae bacterium]
MKDVLVLGVCSVDVIGKSGSEFPKTNSQMPLFSLVNIAGGNALNTAIDCAKIGLSTAIVGCIGTDYQGRFLLEELSKYKVDIRGMQQKEDSETGCCVIMQDGDCDRLCFPFGGANAHIDPEKIPQELTNEANIIIIQGLFNLPSVELKLAEFLKSLKEQGKTILVDISPNIKNVTFKEIDSTCRAIAPYVDYFMPSEIESLRITGSDDMDVATQSLHDKGFYNVIIKRAEEGSIASLSRGEMKAVVPTVYVQPRDVTGAGDAFVAGFAYGLKNNYSALDSILCGNLLGRECVLEFGASTNINEESLNRFHEIVKGPSIYQYKENGFVRD